MVIFKMDGSTTYCYYISNEYSQEQVVKDDVLISSEGSACPITIRVDIAEKLEKNTLIPLRYTATLDTSSADANFKFPEPIVRVPVPDYLMGGTHQASGSKDEETYDVAVANVVMCDWRSCNIFSEANESSTIYSSRNNPNRFSDNVAVFGSEELVISKDGKYTGYVHLVVNIGGTARADFVTFFPVQIGDVAGTTPSSIITDGTTTYCWTSSEVSVFDPSVSGDLTIRTGKYCPGNMSMSLSSTDVLIGDTIDITWSVDMPDSSAGNPTLIAEVSTADAIRNPRTDIYAVVPVSVFSGCQRSSDRANCSTYTGDESTTFVIAEYNDMNLTNRAVGYSTRYTFDKSGQYTMFGRVAMVTVDGERLDMAIYSSVTASVQGGSNDSYLFLYVGIGIGAVILLAGLLFCYIKKRSNHVSTKEIPFRQPVRGLERSSDHNLASSNFLLHKTPATLQDLDLSNDYSTGKTGPSYLVVNASDSSIFDRTINVETAALAQSMESGGSFSLNPYGRTSFVDLGSNNASSRPSDTSKFSFQSGYDDETDWEYDTRQIRSNGRGSNSDFLSNSGPMPAVGTFDIDRGTNMPILEEDALDDLTTNQHPSNGTFALRNTASSGWTIN